MNKTLYSIFDKTTSPRNFKASSTFYKHPPSTTIRSDLKRKTFISPEKQDELKQAYHKN